MLLTAKKTHLRGRNGEKGGNVDERFKERQWEEVGSREGKGHAEGETLYTKKDIIHLLQVKEKWGVWRRVVRD